jgi:hypothetical protein
MHDPLAVAFEIRRPWPQRTPMHAASDQSTRWRIRLHHDHTPMCTDDPPHKGGAFPWWRPSSYSAFWRLAGRDYYWPPLIVVWHREPGGRDALTQCSRRVQRAGGTWHRTRTWRLHIHHWRLQFPPLQQLRRRLLTRCTWCGGRSVKGDPVNVSSQWDRKRGHWWQGETGLFHSDCSAVHSAHAACTCEEPILDSDTYGHCARCTRFRAFGVTPERIARQRQLAAVPHGARRFRAAAQPKEPTMTEPQPCTANVIGVGDDPTTPIQCDQAAGHDGWHTRTTSDGTDRWADTYGGAHPHTPTDDGIDQ